MPRSDHQTATSSQQTIGLIVPFAEDRVPDEAATMYPDASFVARGVGVGSLTPEGYAPAREAILPTAEALAQAGVAAVMIIGTSLTFYKGAEAHRRLLDDVATATGLPVSSMSQAIVDGLRSVGGHRLAVATAYNEDVNQRLCGFLDDEGFDVGALRGFGISEFMGPSRKSEDEILALGFAAYTAAGQADALLVSCGGLRTLGVARPFEEQYDVPVVSSMPAALRQAVRMVGHDSRIEGHGRLLAMT